MRRLTYRLLCQVPVWVRLATGFLFVGLVAVLAVGVVGLLPAQASGLADPLQEQMSAANAELTAALVLLQANESRVQVALLDATTGQSHAVLLGDQAVAQGLATQYQAEVAIFVRAHLFAQQPAQEAQLIGLGQGEAVAQQRGLVVSVTYTWQRYHAAQSQVLQDLLTDQLSAAEMMARFQLVSLGTDALSALSSLMQFQDDLVPSIQHAATVQARSQQLMETLLGDFIALVLILPVGLLVTLSLVIPLRRLGQVTQAVAAGERESPVAIIGHDEIAVIASRFNDVLIALDSLLDEVGRQHDGQVTAAELLVSGISGGDSGAVRAQVAEVGDPLRVLDTASRDAVARFQHVVSSAQAAARQLETMALRTQRQAESVLLDQHRLPVEFGQEIMATARQLEALSRMVAEPLPGSGESA